MGGVGGVNGIRSYCNYNIYTATYKQGVVRVNLGRSNFCRPRVSSRDGYARYNVYASIYTCLRSRLSIGRIRVRPCTT